MTLQVAAEATETHMAEGQGLGGLEFEGLSGLGFRFEDLRG